MDQIKLIINNNEFTVDVIRYFLLNDALYLIYSLNEEDGQGYVKLYVVRVEKDSIGQFVSVSISDDEEWNNVKNAIKEIIKASKTGATVVEDQNYTVLNGLIISNSRVFKLSAPLVASLGENKKTPELVTEEVENTNVQEETSIPEFAKPTLNESVQDEFTPNEETAFSPFNINPEPIANVEEAPSVNESFANAEEAPSVNEPIQADAEFEQAVASEPKVDYEKLYEDLKVENMTLTNKISELEAKLNEIKNILN
ncbi:MAG: DUF1292 domain-containing protein [Bacilli bacterium]|nr:DUF1292 domain-containing protein [Bacilli bacterium]